MRLRRNRLKRLKRGTDDWQAKSACDSLIQRNLFITLVSQRIGLPGVVAIPNCWEWSSMSSGAEREFRSSFLRDISAVIAEKLMVDVSTRLR